MSMTYLRSILFPKRNSRRKDHSSAIVSDKSKFSIKELFSKRNKAKTVIDNVTTSLVPTNAVIARTQKDLDNLAVDLEMAEAMQSLFNAMHHPLLLDERCGLQYSLHEPFIMSTKTQKIIKHGLIRTYSTTLPRQIATAQALQTCIPLSDTYLAVEQTFGSLDGDIIEVMHIPRLERAHSAHSSTIGEASDGFQLNLAAVVTALSHFPSQESRSSWGASMSESLGTGFIPASGECKPTSFVHDETRTMDAADMKIIRFLGEGTTGKVYFAKDQISRARVALKVVEKKGKNEYIISTIVQECDILNRLSDSSWFVQLYGSWHDHDYMYIAMTPYPSDLDSELIRLVKIEPARARFYMAEIIIALTELHKRGIIHRDVKAPNILIDREGHIVLADFGLSMDFYYPPSIAERVYQPYWPYLPDEHADSNTEERDPDDLYFVAWDYRGSELEMAPEIHLGQPYSFGVDFWSAAVVLYWMLTGRPPWYENEDCRDLNIDVEDKPLAFKIAEDNLVFLPSDDVDEVAQDFLHKMLVKNPKRRLMIDYEMPNHPYFAGVNWPLMESRMVPTPWVPGYDICHVYEPTTPVFTPGKPYPEHEDPWPAFTHTSKQAQMRLVCSDYEDADSGADEESESHMELVPHSEDLHRDVGATTANSPVADCPEEIASWGTASGRGEFPPLRINVDANATQESTSVATTDASISRSGSTLPATPTHDSRGGWDITIITSHPKAPYSPGSKRWLQPQDIMHLRPKLPLTMASSTTSISSLEIMYVPAQPPGLGLSPTSVGHISESLTLQNDSGDSSRFPQEPESAANGFGLLSRVKAWWLSQIWTPKPRQNMGVKRLSC